MTQQSVALFLPAWNEAENLPYVVGEAAAFLHDRGGDFTVIIVNDGSTDNTDEVVASLQKVFPGHVQLVKHERNLGYGAALRSGLKAGLDTHYDWVCFVDGDGQFMVMRWEN